MVRVYKRKRPVRGQIPAEVMLRAVKEVQQNGKSIRQAAKEYGIPRTTLCNNITKFVDKPHQLLSPNYHHARIFSDEQETMLANKVLKCSQMCHGLSVKSRKELIYELAKANGLKYPAKWDANKTAGDEWYFGFMRRRKDILSIQQPEASSLARATAFYSHTIGKYFDLLQFLTVSTLL